jgi:guanylate kinase
LKNLFLVDGASSTGKSDLLRWVSSYNSNNVSYVKKGSTRPSQTYEKGEPLDLELIDEDEFHERNYDYVYKYRGFLYGLHRSHIISEIKNKENVFIIIRNISVVKKLCTDFSFINVIPMFIYTDRSQLEARLNVSKTSDEEVAARLVRADECMRDYCLHPDVYREVIINNSDLNIFYDIVNKLLAKHADSFSIDPFLIPVMMSFNKKNEALGRTYSAIEATIKDIGPHYRCSRVNDSPGSPAITSEFRSLVTSSRCIIIDLTGNRHNVYYELGYIHAIGKTCLIIAPKGTRPSFYPREHVIMTYGSTRELRRSLSVRLRQLLAVTLQGVDSND